MKWHRAERDNCQRVPNLTCECMPNRDGVPRLEPQPELWAVRVFSNPKVKTEDVAYSEHSESVVLVAWVTTERSEAIVFDVPSLNNFRSSMNTDAHFWLCTIMTSFVLVSAVPFDERIVGIYYSGWSAYNTTNINVMDIPGAAALFSIHMCIVFWNVTPILYRE